MRIEFRVLGPVSVLIDEEPIPLDPRQQALLGVLLIEPNRLVSRDQLLERVWGEARSVNAMHTQLTLLRRALAPIPDVTINWQGGYRLTIDETTIDLHRFRDLVDQARAGSVELWDEALALWRGEPFTGLTTPWLARRRTALLAEHYAAMLDRTDVLLSFGRNEAVLPTLIAQAQDHPLDERVAGQLMLALHGAGRTSEALEHYARLQERLINELGADPGLPLRDVHQRLLTGQSTPNPPARSRSPIPRQLPAAPGSFTGRTRELGALTRILDTAAERGGTLVISATSGTGGIGKTWLSLYWAHQFHDRFPDGQLFVDLRGFSPEARPMDPATAIRRFLDALGVDPANIPASVDAQAAMWRTLATDKRLLVLLDNAASTEQVVPLLPGGSSSTVLVNSRDHLTGLITGHGAQPVSVDILSDSEARDLLGTRLGPERLAAEPDAVDELLAHCGGFPLALSIVAGQALNHPDFPLAAIATELSENRLAALDDGDPAASLPSVLSWSYAALTDEQARAFGLLGVVPGADIDLTAAANLFDRSAPETRSLMRSLARASLVRQDQPGRYGMHDLVRAYAREQSGPDADDALRRLVDFYLHTAHAGDALIKPSRARITLPAAAAGARPGGFDRIDEAMRWFTEELHNLTALHQDLAARGWHEPTWQLAWTMSIYCERTGRLVEDVDSWRMSMKSVLALADHAVEARARQHLGDALARVERYEEGLAELTEAIRIAADTGDLVTESFAERGVARLYDLQGNWQEVLQRSDRCLEMWEKIGNPVWIAIGLSNVGWVAAHVGNYEYARSSCERAAQMMRQYQPDDRSSVGHMIDSLGYIAYQMGRYEEAIDYYEQSRAEYAISGDIYFDADALDMLGATYRALGQLDKARECWQQAWQIFHDHQRPVAAQRVADMLDKISADGGDLAADAFG